MHNIEKSNKGGKKIIEKTNDFYELNFKNELESSLMHFDILEKLFGTALSFLHFQFQ